MVYTSHLLIEGEKQYHFIEVMTCPGGCIGGGGQHKDKNFKGDELRKSRIANLYKRDQNLTVRKSHENEGIKALKKNLKSYFFTGKKL